MNYFVVSDIHGHLERFDEVLQHFDPRTQQLVLLGDYIDRGPNSLGVLQRIMELKNEHPTTVVLMGNHEDTFLQFIRNDIDFKDLVLHLENDGGKETLDSFTGDMLDTFDLQRLKETLETIRMDILSKHQALVHFLQHDLQYFYETDHILFTHAGYNTSIARWTETAKKDFIWIRGHYKNRPTSQHLNVFGHTRVFSIREFFGEGYSNDPLLLEYVRGAYLAIDGACAYGGKLNAVVLNQQGKILHTYAAK